MLAKKGLVSKKDLYYLGLDGEKVNQVLEKLPLYYKNNVRQIQNECYVWNDFRDAWYSFFGVLLTFDPTKKITRTYKHKSHQRNKLAYGKGTIARDVLNVLSVYTMMPYHYLRIMIHWIFVNRYLRYNGQSRVYGAALQRVSFDGNKLLNEVLQMMLDDGKIDVKVTDRQKKYFLKENFEPDEMVIGYIKGFRGKWTRRTSRILEVIESIICRTLHRHSLMKDLQWISKIDIRNMFADIRRAKRAIEILEEFYDLR